jgi:hypothetical protein
MPKYSADSIRYIEHDKENKLLFQHFLQGNNQVTITSKDFYPYIREIFGRPEMSDSRTRAWFSAMVQGKYLVKSNTGEYDITSLGAAFAGNKPATENSTVRSVEEIQNDLELARRTLSCLETELADAQNLQLHKDVAALIANSSPEFLDALKQELSSQ